MSFSVVGRFCISGRWFSPFLLFQQNRCSSFLSSSQSSAESFFSPFSPSAPVLPLPGLSYQHLNMPGFMYISQCKGMQPSSHPAFPCSDDLSSFLFNSGIPRCILHISHSLFDPLSLWVSKLFWLLLSFPPPIPWWSPFCSLLLNLSLL